MQTLKEAKILTKLNGRLSKLLKFVLTCKCYDEPNFPFVIATDQLKAYVFLVNINTQKRAPFISLKQVHLSDSINDIEQSSKLIDPTKAKHYTNLKQITLHFKLNQCKKDGSDLELIYCQVKLSYEAI